MNFRSGVVINVVTSVIKINITKMGGGRIFISYPMVSAISSISPCVFISAPSEKLFFQLSFSNRAESNAPPNLPTVEKAMKSRQVSHMSGESISPISVRNPVDAKNSGRNSTSDISSTFSVIIFRKRKFSGITNPVTKAPNSACKPKISVR